ncbi:MAG: hydroxyacid dehydrogenase [Candidatus Eiseniibacteriota bacterium]
MNILAADALDEAAIAALRAAGHEVAEVRSLQGAELARALEGCSALIVRGATRVTAEVLGAAPSLRVVVRAGTGLDNIDLEAAKRLGVRVSNTPAANAVSVAELVFGLLIALERRIPESSLALREGRWEKSAGGARELAGRRLSLVGFGRIGREVARRAVAFEMEVKAHDPLLKTWPPEFTHVSRITLDQALERADVLSLHVPLSADTRALIGERQLAMMPAGSVLVNAARGGLVDETALDAALEAGHLRGAALDVFGTEPPGRTPLLERPNVIGTPHLGASTAEAQRRAGLEAAAIVIAALEELHA